MILPIVAYGDPVLKKRASEVGAMTPELEKLIENMWETMYEAAGVGLAAPQIGQSVRLFVVDASPFEEDEPQLADFKKIFINPIIVEEEGNEWKFNEGCLSIPTIREDVERKPTVRITYLDEKFQSHEETYEGIAARIIQHEYDHLEGVLFTDRISPLKRKLLKRKLSEIAAGNVDVKYKMRFPVRR
ncbi:MAG: peptide deformylase [Flavobacteriales bacterium]|nr:peptide deformylase [Flavobacteriales bacterium]MCB9447789.1 peptide deformylase [Flavobacteriales bacterium]